jgi:excinuclease UvrABC helicase subunit UvrB
LRHPGLLNLLQQDSGYQSIVQGLNQKLQSQVVYGLVGSQKSFWVSGVLGQGSQPMVIIAPDEDVARKWAVNY